MGKVIFCHFWIKIFPRFSSYFKLLKPRDLKLIKTFRHTYKNWTLARIKLRGSVLNSPDAIKTILSATKELLQFHVPTLQNIYHC